MHGGSINLVEAVASMRAPLTYHKHGACRTTDSANVTSVASSIINKAPCVASVPSTESRALSPAVVDGGKIHRQGILALVFMPYYWQLNERATHLSTLHMLSPILTHVPQQRKERQHNLVIFAQAELCNSW
jgi:hypothetical protein